MLKLGWSLLTLYDHWTFLGRSRYFKNGAPRTSYSRKSKLLPFPWWMLMMFKFDAKQIRVNSVSMVPWKLRSRWKNCVVLTHSMSFRVSHIFREGNGCTDTLANYAIHENGFTWWI
ncbi:hypothetical protein HKD37_15G044301 [Glycine soja]